MQVDFNLPGEEERLQMVIMYLEKYVLNPPSAKAKPIKVRSFVCLYEYVCIDGYIQEAQGLFFLIPWPCLRCISFKSI